MKNKLFLVGVCVVLAGCAHTTLPRETPTPDSVSSVVSASPSATRSTIVSTSVKRNIVSTSDGHTLTVKSVKSLSKVDCKVSTSTDFCLAARGKGLEVYFFADVERSRLFEISASSRRMSVKGASDAKVFSMPTGDGHKKSTKEVLIVTVKDGTGWMLVPDGKIPDVVVS